MARHRHSKTATPDPRPGPLPTLLAAITLAGTLSTAQATLTPEESARLGRDLTPMGAERAGNASGSIPPWTGGLARPAPPDAAPTDPYADERPITTITAANAPAWRDRLPPGQLELLRRASARHLDVYPTHRTAAWPAAVIEAVREEAPHVQLTAGGTGLSGVAHATVPFPVPHSGVEVLWNHMLRWRGGTLVRHQTQFPVQANGSFTPVTREETLAFASALPKPEPNRLLYYLTTLTGPSSLAGESNLLHAMLDPTKEPNQVWAYNPGQRRVLRAPDLCCDAPQIGADGLATIDDYDGFFAPTDRFEWRLLGKRELVVPYNNWRLADRRARVDELIRPDGLDPARLRYELHRVWVVEGTLKPGARHVYGKRVFYVDEDSWQILHADEYDRRGELWRVHELYAMPRDDVPMMWMAGDAVFDLQARRYVVFGLGNQLRPMRVGLPLDARDFSVDALRRAGR